jgi:hypothetical protein
MAILARNGLSRAVDLEPATRADTMICEAFCRIMMRPRVYIFRED